MSEATRVSPVLPGRHPSLDRGSADDRLLRVRQALDSVRKRCNVASRLQVDPVAVLHRYRDPLEQEIVGLLASAVAFGNAKAFRAKLEDALERLSPRLLDVVDDEDEALRRLAGWKHRVYSGDDVAGLLVGARRVQRGSGSLGTLFKHEWERAAELRMALVSFTRAIREAGGLGRARSRGSRHILSDPSKSSGCKRLLLYLRWMIRPYDGVDLGLWSVPPRILLIPVDTHVHRLATNLGFTKRRNVSWQTAEEITAALRRFDPEDPVKYDFALCHLGMLQRCPSRRDPSRCRGCGVLGVCRHWAHRPR